MSVGLDVALLVLVLVVVSVALAAWRVRQRRDIAPVPPPDVTFTPAPPEVPIEEQAISITWTAQLTAATLDEAARLRLIDDLVLLQPAWSVELLRRAHEEERSPRMRARIAEALVSCGEPIETQA